MPNYAEFGDVRRAFSFWRDNVQEIGTRGVDVLLYGDSLTSGMNSSTLFNTWGHRLKVLLQDTFNGRRGGGFGYLPLREAPNISTWDALDATNYGGQNTYWWTMEGDGTPWAATSDHAIQKKRTANAVAGSNTRTRYFLDATDPWKRLRTTDIEFVMGCDTTTGAATTQLTTGPVDAGFQTVSGQTLQTNATTLVISDTYGRHMGRSYSDLTANVSRTVQLAATTGTIYPEGMILYNGDYQRGVRTHNVGRCGASTADGLATPSYVATFDNWMARTGSGADNARLMIFSLGTNDCNNQVTIANFTTRVELIRDRVTALGCGVLFVGMPVYDPSLRTKTIPYQSYLDVMASAGSVANCGYLDLNRIRSSASWEDTTTSHHSDHGNRQIAMTMHRLIASALI